MKIRSKNNEYIKNWLLHDVGIETAINMSLLPKKRDSCVDASARKLLFKLNDAERKEAFYKITGKEWSLSAREKEFYLS